MATGAVTVTVGDPNDPLIAVAGAATESSRYSAAETALPPVATSLTVAVNVPPDQATPVVAGPAVSGVAMPVPATATTASMPPAPAVFELCSVRLAS